MPLRVRRTSTGSLAAAAGTDPAALVRIIPAMRAAMSAYQSGDRIVLVPCFQETAPFPIWTEDVEWLTVTGTRVSETDLGSLAIGLLRNPRRREFEQIMRGEQYRQRTAARRRALCKAFGVKTVAAWLDGCKLVHGSARGDEVTFTPCRRQGKREAWTGSGVYKEASGQLSDPEEVGAALRQMLALDLTPEP